MSVLYAAGIRNEADIIYYQLQYYYKVGVRNYLIIDNDSTDETRWLIDLFVSHYPEATVEVVVDKVHNYETFFTRKYERIDRYAKRQKANWVLPVDADELITPHDPNKREGFNLVKYLSQFEAKPDNYLHMPFYYYAPKSSDCLYEANPFKRITHRRSGSSNTKTIYCPGNQRLLQGAHGYRSGNEIEDHHLFTAHFSYRSPYQVMRKTVAFGEAMGFEGEINPENLNNEQFDASRFKGKVRKLNRLVTNPAWAGAKLERYSKEAIISDPVWR